MQERRVAVRGLIIKDNALFCVKLKMTPGKEPSESLPYWCVPGGGVDPGEPLLEALEREFIEEVGIKPVIGSLLFIQQFIHNDKEQLELFFHVTNTRDFDNIDLTSTSHGVIELAEVGFVDPKNNHVLPAFLGEEDFVATLEAGVTKIFNYM